MVKWKETSFDGPAIESLNGARGWWLNGKIHREDDSAIEWDDGTKYWYLKGVEYTEEEFNKIQLNKKLQSKLDEKPSIKRVKI